MNLLPGATALRQFASEEDLKSADAAIAREILRTIVSAGSSALGWQAILELLGAWREPEDTDQWVAEHGAALNEWPWQLRTMHLGHRASTKGKASTYRIVGHLLIRDIEDLGGKKARQWAGREDWAGIKGLSLYKLETYPAHIGILTGSPHLQGLEMLSLKVIDHLRGGLSEALGGERLPRLTALELRSCGLGAEDMAQLAGLPLCRQLERLDLGGNMLGGPALEQVWQPEAFPRLQELGLADGSLTAAALEAAHARAPFSQLKSIQLSRNPAADTLGETWTPPA